MCGAQACLCIQGVILGRDSWGPSSSFGFKKFVRIFLKGEEVCIILTVNLNLILSENQPKCYFLSLKTVSQLQML